MSASDTQLHAALHAALDAALDTAATASSADEARPCRWLLAVRAPWLDAALQALDGHALRPRRLTSAADEEWTALSVTAPALPLRRALALVGASEDELRVGRCD